MTRVALVTGAGSGIGRAATLALLNAGYAVVLAGRRREALEQTLALAAAPAAALAVATDVTSETSVTALFAAIEARYGRLDVLFNNAGIGAAALPVDELSFEQWNQVIAVNLNGSFLCARAAFRLMKRQRPAGGRIINNGSISAQVPRPLSAPYTAAKHAITGLSKSLALDGRAHNIACGQIDIGNAGTDMTERMSRGALQADGSYRPEATMAVRHVADAIVQMANLPLDVSIPQMTIMATQMPFGGRG
jgi:NAD(P)-dependent dehydrogenase (short-subunit alcohol dehydrogenase family)